MSAANSSDDSTHVVDELNRDVYIFTNLVASRFSSDIEGICRKENLTEAHYRILWVLCMSESRNGLAMGDIVDGLVNKASDATRLVDKLEKQGLVSRLPSELDKRKMIVSVTTTGRRVFSRLTTNIKSAHIRQMKGLSNSDKRHLVDLLNKALWGTV